uniref:Shisa like 2A n=1 Tax=Salmo trutta TaxID=8032 RepID=A0A674BU86_SALTR
MSADCTSYYNAEKVLVNEFTCPKPDNDAGALFCCGFNDMKYCCDDPNSFFPYEYGYMWWLSLGALVGLSIAAVVLLAFIITICVLCYLFIATKPRGLDNGLPLIAPGITKRKKTKTERDNLFSFFCKKKMLCYVIKQSCATKTTTQSYTWDKQTYSQ